MSRNRSRVFAAGIALAMLVAGCTGSDAAEAPEDGASTPNEGAATSDDMAPPADENVVRRVVVEELPLDPAEAAGFELPEELFDLEGIDSFRLDFHAVGTLEPLGAEPEPALYRTRGRDLTSWMRVDLPIPEGYVRGGLSTVDHPGRYVAWLQDADDAIHALLVTKGAEAVALIDDAVSISIDNVVDVPDGDLVLGSSRDEEGRQAAAWLVDADGRVVRVALPDEAALSGDAARLTAALHDGDRYLLFGVDGEGDALVALAGEALDELTPSDLPEGVIDAARVHTIVRTSDTWWAGGSVSDDDTTMQAIWSSTDTGTWRERAGELRELAESEPEEGSITGLGASTWPVPREPAHDDVVMVTKGEVVMRWAVDGEEAIYSVRRGGDRATFADATALVHSRDFDEWAWESARDAEMLDVRGLPVRTGSEQSGRMPWVTGAVDGHFTVFRGHDGDGETALLSPEGDVVGRADGQFWPYRSDGRMLLVGVSRRDGIRPRIVEAFAEEDDWVTHDPEVADEVTTARTNYAIDVGDTLTAVGHQWTDEGLRPLFVQENPDGEWEEIDVDGADADRGMNHGCGEVAWTYDAAFDLGLAWPAEGGVSDLRFEEDLELGWAACDQDAAGHLWALGADDELLRIGPDGGHEAFARPAPGPVGLLAVVGQAEAEHVVVVARDQHWSTTWSLWTRPVDGGDWQGGEAVPAWADVRYLELLHSPDMDVLVTGSRQRQPAVWRLGFDSE